MPTPDGGRLKPVNVVEKVTRSATTDTVDVMDGEFRLDTTRIGADRAWLVTRRSIDVLGKPVLDSVWMDRYTLKTIRSVRYDSQGVTRLEIDRRSVRGTRITKDGHRQSWRGLHEQSPYGLAGIDVVLGAMPLRQGSGGALPVVTDLGDRMHFLEYEVKDFTTMPRMVSGGMVFDPVWIVEAHLDGRTLHYWIDPEMRAVVQRTAVAADGEHFLVKRGNAVIRVELAPVDRLPGATNGMKAIGGE